MVSSLIYFRVFLLAHNHILLERGFGGKLEGLISFFCKSAFLYRTMYWKCLEMTFFLDL